MKNLKIWKVHPKASKVQIAEKTCKGTANLNGVKWCGPYSSVNKMGFWVYAPVDLDFVCEKGEYKVKMLESFSNEDYFLVKSLERSSDNFEINKWMIKETGRTKFTWGAVEKNVVQIWTGLIFKTPPNWALQIRSPINFPKTNFHVMEGILETDWLQYDIWINLVCEPDQIISIRKEFPIAHLIPIPRDSFEDDWKIEENTLNRNSQEDNFVFEYWVEYNKKKFANGGKQFLTKDGSLTKDGTTYFKEKKKMCPFRKMND
jgi:hypothetical protein